MKLILDTDIGTDVDDALALAFALRHPDLDLRAVTTVSGDTVRRARIAKMLLRLAGRDDVEVAPGVSGEISQPHRLPEAGHEDAMLLGDTRELPPPARDAVTLLLDAAAGGDVAVAPGVSGEISQPHRLPEAGHEDAMLLGDTRELPPPARDAVTLLLDATADGDVAVATVGMQSNLVAALERDSSLASRVPRLAVMGGVFAPVRVLGAELPPTVDHNLNVDQPASLRALNAGMPTLWTPCDVTFNAWLRAPQLDRLRRGDALCQALARQIDIWTPHMHRMGRGAIPEDHVCLLHDPLAIAVLVDRRFVTSMEARVTVAMHEGHVRTFIDPAAGQAAEIITGVDGDAFAEFWLETVLG